MLQDFVHLNESLIKLRRELTIGCYNGYKIKENMNKVLVKKFIWECINLLLDLDDKLEKR